MDNVTDLPVNDKASVDESTLRLLQTYFEKTGDEKASIPLKGIFIATVMFALLSNQYVDTAISYIPYLASPIFRCAAKAALFFLILYVILA